MDRGSHVRTVPVPAPARRTAEARTARRAAEASTTLRRTAVHPRTGRRLAGPRRADPLTTAVGTLDLMRRLAWVPERAPAAGPPAPLPDVQFDLDHAVPPAAVVDGIEVRFGPVHTVFVTAALSGPPTRRDQRTLGEALDAVERAYPWGPGGCVAHVAYGLPYFRRLPAGLVALHLPRLLSDNDRFVLEEAVPARGDVRVRIERSDLLITLRGDDPGYLRDVLRWLGGSGTLAGRPVPSPRLDVGLRITSTRVMFSQLGLPRSVAAARRLPFRFLVHPRSPMWPGPADLSADRSTETVCPVADVTFGGMHGSHLTTAGPGDYFDNGAVQHLSHDILDSRRFSEGDDPAIHGDDESYLERIRYLFHRKPSGFENTGSRDTLYGRHRLGHAACPHRASLTTGGRSPHQRLDGPGFDNLDVPDGSPQPKREFCVFMPTSDHLVTAHSHPGPEPSGMATRRQNFLVPPRRHRAFPLLELA